jgi:hypothetical protein
MKENIQLISSKHDLVRNIPPEFSEVIKLEEVYPLIVYEYKPYSKERKELVTRFA